MKLQRRILSLLGGAALSFLALSASASECRKDTVHLRGDWGTARFSVEVADNASARARGLMGRPSMPTSSGMLFVYHRTDEIAFWMKNTLIPLDIIFMDETGVVVKVHHYARPHDLTPLHSTAPSRYVLEVNGGLAQALGIEKGSEIRHPAVLQHTAAWACRETG